MRFYFFLLQRFCMAVLTHLNPPCWKWIWHMRNEDFGSYSAHLNHYTDRFVTFKNIYINTARIWKLKCWYLRLNVVSFEIERRSNGSLKIKSIVTEIERESLSGRTRHKNIACYINVIFPRHSQRASLRIVNIFIGRIESAVARHSC